MIEIEPGEWDENECWYMLATTCDTLHWENEFTSMESHRSK